MMVLNDDGVWSLIDREKGLTLMIE